MICWAVAAGLFLLLAGCGLQPPRPRVNREPRRLEAEFNQAWDAATRVLTERGYQIVVADQTSGNLETDWQTINPEYAATVFVTQHEDRYAGCGKPALGQAFRGKQAQLELALSPTRRRVTEVTIRARFRTHRWTDPLLWQGQHQETVECQSRGHLEDEVAMQIQLELVGEHLERLRRGTP